jgi:GntR family transcriptional repressor for pyruvate dehydrogenase complex
MPPTDQASRLAEQFERDILAGKFAPGDMLPSERDISAQLGVSRNVVREALGRLASLGLVRRAHGSGTRVEPPSGRAVVLGYQRLLSRPDLRLEDLSAVRLPLETAMAALAAQRRTEADLERLDRAQRVLGDPRRSLEAHVQADVDFHAALGDAAGNPFFALVLAPIQELLIESRRRTLGRYGAALAFDHHARILDAVRAGDADSAERAMRLHLQTNYEHLKGEAEEEEHGRHG